MKRCIPSSVDGLAPSEMGFPSRSTSRISSAVIIPLLTAVRVVRKFPFSSRALTFPSVAVTNPRAESRWQISTSWLRIVSTLIRSSDSKGAQEIVYDVVLLERRHHINSCHAALRFLDELHRELHANLCGVCPRGSDRLSDLVGDPHPGHLV